MGKVKILKDGINKVLGWKSQQKDLTQWFVYQEIKMNVREAIRKAGNDPDAPEMQAEILCNCVSKMPLTIPEGSVFAGSQDAAFSPSYALINPNFRVETFAGYSDPLAVYDDIQPNEQFPKERIEKVRRYFASTSYVRRLKNLYKHTGNETKEVAYFVEPVTGHMIPDCREILADGIESLVRQRPDRATYSITMKSAARAPLILADRYATLAKELLRERNGDKYEVSRLKTIIATCEKVPRHKAEDLYEAVQCFILLWQVMCLEQAPNPYAFSAGNLDRVFMPFLHKTTKSEAVQIIRHLLAFFMVGNRCWAISQNILVGGMDEIGNDLTNPMTYIILEAFYQSNCPQPALSVRLHRWTPSQIYKNLGKFFFTPGHSTPLLFNDESMLETLRKKGIEQCDLSDYAIAGCQEPLIMGRENGNTTNSWLNLAKVLELTLHDGKSALSGEKIGLSWKKSGYGKFSDVIANLEDAFWKQFDYFLEKMRNAANVSTEILAEQPVPFCSILFGGLDTGHDLRDIRCQGTKYNSSGCLIHGLSVIVDSFNAIDKFLEMKIGTAEELLDALQGNYKGYDKIKDFLAHQDKYGNNMYHVDEKAAKTAEKICVKIKRLKNPCGNSFQPDFSTPSTHLLYGYWVGATPDGRSARGSLGYGIDPIPGMAKSGLQERILSNKHLPFTDMSGGYASHIGLDNTSFCDKNSLEGKGLAMKERIISPLFSYSGTGEISKNAPYYVYFNVDGANHLRKVLKDPDIYAPGGIYIMRIHGTFVNFLDLSPAIQEDIIERLDPASAALSISS